MGSISSIENMDKLVQNVIASFQIDHIEIPPDIIIKSKEMMMDQYYRKNCFCKKLVKGNRRVYDK